MVHLDGLHFSGDVLGSEGDDHSWLDDSSLDSSDWDSSNTSDLVDILEWQTERSVGWTLGWDDGIQSLQQGLSGSASNCKKV